VGDPRPTLHADGRVDALDAAELAALDAMDPSNGPSAGDASADGSGKRDQAWRVGEDAEGTGKGGLKLPVDRDALSAALGRSNAVHVALIDQKAADRVMHHLGRWLNFKGCSNAPLDSAASVADVRGHISDVSAID
jgi:hypothetical protein